MTEQEAISGVFAFMLYGGMLCLIGSGFLLRISRRELDDARSLLAEVSQTNAEFSEAMALFKYGALDEAIEIASRAQKRREATP